MAKSKAPTRTPQYRPKKPDANLPSTRTSNVRWWEETLSSLMPGTEPKVFAVVRAIVNENGGMRRQSLLTWWRMYQNFESRGLSAASYFRPRFDAPARLKLNIVKSAIDTLHSRTIINEPRVTYLTSGGNWSDQKKAKQLDRLTSGVFYENEFAKKARATDKDSLIFGIGALQGYENDEGRVAIDRIPIEEIIVDDLESHGGKARSLYRTKHYSRDELRAKFEGNAHALAVIDKTPVASVDPEFRDFAERADLVTVIEAWHLPSGPVRKLSKKRADEIAAAEAEARAEGEKDEPDPAVIHKALERAEAVRRQGNDGAHMIVTEAGILWAGSWAKRWFPFVFKFRTPPQRGFLNGVGVAEEIAGLQYEINKALQVLSRCLPFCVPKVLVDRAANVLQAHLDSTVMGRVDYTNRPPELMTWNAFPVQLLEAIERWVRQAYEILGISQMSAQSRKPADLESGEALRTFDNIEGGRHFELAKGYEDMYVDTAKLVVRLTREIAERNGGSYLVKVPFRRKRILDIDWKEIGLADDAFIIQAFPVSNLPRTPEGRLAMIQDLMKLGFLDKEDAIRLLALPDLDAVNELMEAAADFVHWQLENIIDNGDPQVAEPFMNLRYALDHAQAAYLSMRTMKLPEARAKMLLDYIQSIKDMAAKTAPAQPAPAPGEQPGIPGGPPTMPGPGMPQVAPMEPAEAAA